jgi:hypothetical protein
MLILARITEPLSLGVLVIVRADAEAPAIKTKALDLYLRKATAPELDPTPRT